MAQRVTQASVEIASDSATPIVRVTQAAVEVASTNTAPNALITQASAEIASSAAEPEGRGTQVYAAVLVYATSSHVWSNAVFGGSSFPAGGTVSLGPPPAPPVSIIAPFSGGRVGAFKPRPGDADEILLALERIAQKWQQAIKPEQILLQARGGLRGLGSHQELLRPDAKIRTRKPFLHQKAVVTPAPSAGEVAVVEFEVPEGFYGVITGYGWDYTGTGYVPGSTDIYWRLKIGMRFPKGLGQVAYELGDPRDPMKTGALIPLRPRQRVKLIVKVVNDSGAIQVGASYILGALCGWFYEPYREFAP